MEWLYSIVDLQDSSMIVTMIVVVFGVIKIYGSVVWWCGIVVRMVVWHDRAI